MPNRKPSQPITAPNPDATAPAANTPSHAGSPRDRGAPPSRPPYSPMAADKEEREGEGVRGGPGRGGGARDGAGRPPRRSDASKPESERERIEPLDAEPDDGSADEII